MRMTVAGPVEAKRGQTVRIVAKQRKDAKVSFCEVYSKRGDYEPSPHVQLEKMAIKDNRPMFLTPMTFRLHEQMMKRELLVKADEDCSFFLMQDVDTKSDPRVKARIKLHGKRDKAIVQAVRWLHRNLGW